MLSVGRIPYLNCEPFFHRLGGVELVDLIPRRLGEAMAAGGLDAGPLSLMDYSSGSSRSSSPCPSASAAPRGARSVLCSPTGRSRDLRGARVGITGGDLDVGASCCGCCWPSATRSSPRAWVGAEEPCRGACS